MTQQMGDGRAQAFVPEFVLALIGQHAVEAEQARRTLDDALAHVRQLQAEIATLRDQPADEPSTT